MESFKYPLMELSCKHHPQGENAVSLYSLQECDHWQFSVQSQVSTAGVLLIPASTQLCIQVPATPESLQPWRVDSCI